MHMGIVSNWQRNQTCSIDFVLGGRDNGAACPRSKQHLAFDFAQNGQRLHGRTRRCRSERIGL